MALRPYQTVPAPATVTGASPYIDASIRRTALEQEQARALQRVCDELGLDPRIERRLRHKWAKSYARINSRRTNKPSHRFTRNEVITRDKSTCYLCGKTCEREEIHIDHVVPLSKGGTHTLDNVKVACATCNLRKGDAVVLI